MINKIKDLFFICLLLILSTMAEASPFVVSDPTAQKVTHCGVVLDSGSKIDVPVITVTPTTAICKYDISAVSIGQHTIKTTFIYIDPVWGRAESTFSAPLDFERPSGTISNAPTNLTIIK